MNYGMILSGGVGSRMQSGNMPKQYLEVNGKPILMYTIVPFDESDKVDHIVIVAHPQWHDQIKSWLKEYDVKTPVTIAANGENRQDSVISGLKCCASIKAPEKGDKVIIHDAVRPLVDKRIIADCFDALNEYSCCVTCIPDYDTTWVSLDGKTLTKRANRDELVLGQTPEGFDLPLYLELNETITEEELATIHGCSELPFIRGYDVKIVQGSVMNIKLTRPEDMIFFKALINANIR